MGKSTCHKHMATMSFDGWTIKFKLAALPWAMVNLIMTCYFKAIGMLLLVPWPLPAMPLLKDTEAVLVAADVAVRMGVLARSCMPLIMLQPYGHFSCAAMPLLARNRRLLVRKECARVHGYTFKNPEWPSPALPAAAQKPSMQVMSAHSGFLKVYQGSPHTLCEPAAGCTMRMPDADR